MIRQVDDPFRRHLHRLGAEDLEDLRAWGAAAERTAKNPSRISPLAPIQDVVHGDRDGLAVTLRTRGSNAVTVRERWRNEAPDVAYETLTLDQNTPLDARLRWWAECFKRGAIPARFPYELREASRFYESGWSDAAVCARAACTDTCRIFDRKDIVLVPGDKEENNARMNMLRQYIAARLHDDAAEMKYLADEMIIAKWIGDAERAAVPANHGQGGAPANNAQEGANA